MDVEMSSGNSKEERSMEVGYVADCSKFLLIDITVFLGVLKSCYEAVGNKVKRNRIEKLMEAEDWIEHYYDRSTGRRVLAESRIEYKHELNTAIALAQIDYHVVFAPKGMFKWNEKKFDVFLIKEHVILKADLKSILSKNPDTIAKRIKGGSEQASRVVLDVLSDIEKKSLVDGLRSGIEKNKLIIEILLLYKGKFYKLPKTLIESKRIYEIIK